MILRRDLVIKSIGACIILTLQACGVQEASENYSLTKTTELILTQDSHKHGYGHADCFSCHNVANIHVQDRLGTPMVALARSMIEKNGLSVCSGCHGQNGVK